MSSSRAARLLASLILSIFFVLGCGAAGEEAPQAAAPAPVVARGGAEQVPAVKEDAPVPVSSADPTWGKRTALVTIVEIADFQCPFCARASATIEKLRTEYGPDKVRVVWKHLPLAFHPEAKPAAEMAAAVMIASGSDAFWKFHDKVFANQLTLSSASYEDWAREAGADLGAVRRAIESGAARSKVAADMELTKAIDVQGTPSFFINGVRLDGARPIEAFRAVVDVELEKANAKLKAGVAPEKLYATIATENFQKGPPREEEEEEPADTRIYKVAVGKSPARGPADALLTLVVFSDFQCPYCKRAEPTLAELEKRYAGSLRVVWKDLPLPFHPRAEPAAQLAREARAQKGDAAFWQAHDKLFDSQPQLEDADLERIAKELSLDTKKALAAVKSHKHKALLDADESLADDVKAEGTPHFFVNGRRVVGAQPLEEFVKVFDEELARAKAAVSRGVAPKDVYEAVTKDGVGASPPETRTVKVVGKAPVSGPASARVALHVFSDFQCPFCGRVLPTLAELRKEYGAKMRVVWHNLPLPFHKDAHLAAEAALEVQAQKGDAAFWKMHDTLFANQRTEGGLQRDALESYAKKLGVDAKRFAEALDTNKHKARVDDEARAANQAGIAGTPTFVIATEETSDSITGYYIAGAQPTAKFRKLIERALSEKGTKN